MAYAVASQEFVRSTPAPAALRDVELPLTAQALTAPYARGEEIYAEEEPATYVYRVVSGAVRLTRILSDGRRHISAFLLPGDYFGLEAGPEHRYSAEAIVDSRIALMRRSTIEAQAHGDAGLAQALWKLTAQELDRLQEHMLLLGRKSAVQRVAAFLLEMADRGDGGDSIELPMSRSDIADYLGLTIETVSRTLSQLERDGFIRLPSTRTIVLRSRRSLAHIDA
ncbi:MAG: helix-turn-helix domain-containing protein [Hydrogenophilaceae bacterium]|jgi:CRP/FNR family nitrogen fixation transcriptional regulator|nr:helix-turn-helix domain-containing protein [Hydrogenophilaceae bacterium]